MLLTNCIKKGILGHIKVGIVIEFDLTLFNQMELSLPVFALLLSLRHFDPKYKRKAVALVN